MRHKAVSNNLSFNWVSPLTPPVVDSKKKKFWWDDSSKQDEQLISTKESQTPLIYPVPYKELKLNKKRKKAK